ncbi:glycosyltransferase [Falsirhodobacter halotolerans]|uniref:glycosyltransferase n=1 Tax=Falsirhodobacter halotolerans TaxID=1146892 RepID=UPI001FCF8252|nr:glycosyltransferase [Falsirhodobacter halotolerans]MCJ8140783.1 glycosyltransferase [Falsirhodobacter halotolerans]
MSDIADATAIPASRYDTGDGTDAYYRAEAEKVIAIYLRRFPGYRVRLVLTRGDDAVGKPAKIVAGHHTLEPDHIRAECLGVIEVGPTDAPAPRVTAHVTIPRPPNPGELAGGEAPWLPRSRVLRTLVDRAPMAYERLRYARERMVQARGARHPWRSLPFGGLSPIFPHAAEPAADRAPAILIGMHWLETGGAEKLALDCVAWARQMGLRVFVVCDVPALQRLAPKLAEGVEFIRLDRYLPAAEWPIFVEALVREENIRIVHIHHCSALYACAAQLRAMTPWVRIIDSTHVVEYADGGYVRMAGVWSNYIHAHHVISRQLRDTLTSRFAATGRVHLGRMLPAGAEALPPARLQGKAKTMSIAFVGRLYYQKRPLTVVLTMKALADWAKGAGVDLTFDFVGEGPFAPAVIQMLGRLGLRDRVRMHPAGTDVPALLARTDILLLPSSNEGLALVCYEAVEKGAIPISTDVGAQGELIPPALLVPRDPAKARRATVAAVRRLWGDDAFRMAQVAALHANYAAIAADPRAEDVIKALYADALEGTA